MTKRLWIVILLGLMLLFAGCADYTAEFTVMTQRFDEMDSEWTELLAEEAALHSATPSFDAIDAFYDKAINQAVSDIEEITEMKLTLESIKDGINEKDYEDFLEVLDDTLNVTQVSVEYFVYDRGWTKAKSIDDDYHILIDEWNNLSKEHKTLDVANGYLERMTEMKEKLMTIEEEIDALTYSEMEAKLDDAIEAFNESIAGLEASSEQAE